MNTLDLRHFSNGGQAITHIDSNCAESIEIAILQCNLVNVLDIVEGTMPGFERLTERHTVIFKGKRRDLSHFWDTFRKIRIAKGIYWLATEKPNYKE